MTLVYKYAGAKGGRVFVEIEVRTSLGTTRLGTRPLPKLAEPFTLLPALKGALKIVASADGQTANVEVFAPLGDDGPLPL